MAVVRAHDPITTRVTWNGEIARLLQARCASCHAPGGTAPMSLTTYEDARPWARAIKDEALTRHRPDWQAVRGYGDFRNDPSLSPFEIALITAWADGGAPKGTEPATNTRATATRSLSATREPSRPHRTITVACGVQRLPAGTLLGVRPALAKDGAAGIAVRFPDGRREIVAWIRGFDPQYSTTYWLRTPLTLPPGSTLTTEAEGRCAVDVMLAAPR